jgi:hypothetical protein
MTLLKIVNTVLIVFAVFMGMKQGWGMVSAKPEMLLMFDKLGIGRTGVLILGVITLVASTMVLFPKTFFYGNFITAASVLFIMALYLAQRDLKGAAIEFPFLLLSLVIIYLRHPLVHP